ncbi:hypothetical protein ACH50O_10755 [Methylomonas sp. 2BW1-5-20]|uniref:hypothetical protein n=1 Tax=Methylomonas sp. 2BW1-5-20 TaxID=3376686 RepID=UPI00404CBC2F
MLLDQAALVRDKRGKTYPRQMTNSIRRQIVGHWQHVGIAMKTILRQAIDRLKEAA